MVRSFSACKIVALSMRLLAALYRLKMPLRRLVEEKIFGLHLCSACVSFTIDDLNPTHGADIKFKSNSVMIQNLCKSRLIDLGASSCSARLASFIVQLLQNHNQTSPVMVNNFSDNILAIRSQLLSSILLMTLMINDVHEQLLKNRNKEGTFFSKQRAGGGGGDIVPLVPGCSLFNSTLPSKVEGESEAEQPQQRSFWNGVPGHRSKSNPNGHQRPRTDGSSPQHAVGIQQKPAGNNTENLIHKKKTTLYFGD